MKKPNICQKTGLDAQKSKGWLGANKYLIFRRVSQFGILFLLVQGISELFKSYYAAKKGRWPDA